jgi:hypothetical protein
VNFTAITIYVASQRVFVVVIVVYFVIDSVRKLLDTPSYFIEVSLVDFGFRTWRTDVHVFSCRSCTFMPRMHRKLGFVLSDIRL